jgi:hypothetical protein
MKKILDLLHIYGQGLWCKDVTIIGSRSALIRLRDAINNTLSAVDNIAITSSFINDGQEFDIIVAQNDTDRKTGQWKTLKTPYDDNDNSLGLDSWDSFSPQQQQVIQNYWDKKEGRWTSIKANQGLSLNIMQVFDKLRNNEITVEEADELLKQRRGSFISRLIRCLFG